MDVDAAVTELYGLGLEDFTARRDELVARARTGGDRALAAQIKALRKPTVVAWLANQLARQHAAELASLLELGESLRLATASLSGEDLRQLSRQRSAVVQALGRRARALAVSLDRPVSEAAIRELEQTLLVALADPEQAADLEAGRLTERLEYSGFSGASEPAPATTGRTATGRRPVRTTDRDPASTDEAAGAPASAAEQARQEARRAGLQTRLERAWRSASAAKQAHAAAGSALADARRSEAASEAAATRLRAELERAEAERAAAEQEVRAAVEAQERTEAALGQARAVVGELQRDVDELPG